jgi:zinc transport system substrate-binding protein
MPRSTPVLALLGITSALAFGCQKDGPPTEAGLPVVVASIFPIGDLTRELAGDAARIEVLLPPGASPAIFEVTPRQIRDFTDAHLFIMIGGGLDEWVSQIPAASGDTRAVIRLAEGIPLLAGDEDEHESGNPHIWLDPILVRDRILPRLEEALREAIPAEAEGLASRRAARADSLTALDSEIRAALAPLQRRAFVATHPAWSYFALRYELEEVGTIHAHPGQEPSSREMAHLMEVAETHQIDCLFMEPQIGEVAARALATELSIPTCLLDPLGGPNLEGRDGYIALLRFNTRQFVQGLQQRAP